MTTRLAWNQVHSKLKITGDVLQWALETLKRVAGADDEDLRFEGFEVVGMGAEEVWRPVMNSRS